MRWNSIWKLLEYNLHHLNHGLHGFKLKSKAVSLLKYSLSLELPSKDSIVHVVTYTVEKLNRLLKESDGNQSN
jgi:fumarate reductase subunit D